MTALTELEERLAQPGGAALRTELIQQLAALEDRLRGQMAASLPRDEFANATALAQAARAAREVLETWPVTGPPGQTPDLQSLFASSRSKP
ncbi:MAG TPA: hypothetical protein VFE82_18645 [Ramlibacter sp.]|jgi:hypothetical protein|uniref:hypothetical protein n=1 Tax=Ramlibacter sp. TaxID=1917967 RepID=UPI002D4FC96B|nr:hypothetical protein [Ramlibacter sp.]HZY20495.1 hypothetical protein [Ramlibacter sp.]